MTDQQSSNAAPGSGWSDADALSERGLIRRRTSAGLSYASGGDGPPLVFLHGGSGAWNHWIANLGPLARRFRVAALDLPGFGLSAPVDPEIPNDDYVALTAAAVVEIADGAPVHLCGFSFGGALAARVAEQLAGGVARLSLVGPNGFPQPTGRSIALYGPKTLAGRLARAPAAAELREMHRNNLSEMMLSRPAALEDPLVDMHAWNVAHTRYNSRRLSWAGDMPALFGRLEQPALVVYGARDRSQNPTIAWRMAELKALRPDAEMIELPDVGHWAMFEAAEAVNAALERHHGL